MTSKKCKSMGSRLLRLQDAGLLEESKIQPTNIPVPQLRKEPRMVGAKQEHD